RRDVPPAGSGGRGRDLSSCPRHAKRDRPPRRRAIMGPMSSSLPDEAFGLPALARFYRFHARVYDWTRPFLLSGRCEAVRALDAGPAQLVLAVGCGTGYSLPRLDASGARVVGIEPSPAMRARAAARIARQRLNVELDERPYGSHAAYEGRASRILFSYSLSM